MRLDKRLSDSGRWSRKEARELIRAGRVRVDGRVCRSPEEKAADSLVEVDGERLEAGGPVYLMLHKPAGVVSATEDAREQTVLSLLPAHYQKKGLFPVGRLDKDTEGLLLLTDDGALAHQLLSPRNHVAKVYYVETAEPLREEDVKAVEHGVQLADGYMCMPGKLELLEQKNCAYITICEGKYHQVKRMMAARGNAVTYLKRVKFGSIALDQQLNAGSWRALTEEEILSIFRQ